MCDPENAPASDIPTLEHAGPLGKDRAPHLSHLHAGLSLLPDEQIARKAGLPL